MGQTKKVNRPKLLKLYDEIYSMKFMHNDSSFSLDELEKLLNAIFTFRNRRFQYDITISMIISNIDIITRFFTNSRSVKLCDESLLIKAFINNGFVVKFDILDEYPNIVLWEYDILLKLANKLK